MKKVRIGGGQGFWGDSPDAAIHMVKNGDLDYLACDYLAELTLSIMQRQKRKDPKAGYAKDFLHLMDVIQEEAYQKKIGIITNAGGMNIEGAVQALHTQAKSKGMTGYKIGYVLGDDIKDQIDTLIQEGMEFRNIDDGRHINEIKDRIVNVNVYHGHEPIVQCLHQGADVVITGRAADSALFLSPLVKEFGWAKDDYD